MWCHYGIALWRHSGGAWHNGLYLITASKVNCWADVANHVAWLWQAGDTKIPNAGSRASYGLYHGLEVASHRINDMIDNKDPWIDINPTWKS